MADKARVWRLARGAYYVITHPKLAAALLEIMVMGMEAATAQHNAADKETER